MTNVLDEYILFRLDRCKGLGTVALQTEDNGSASDSRGHERVIVTQVRFIVQLVARETDEAQVD